MKRKNLVSMKKGIIVMALSISVASSAGSTTYASIGGLAEFVEEQAEKRAEGDETISLPDDLEDRVVEKMEEMKTAPKKNGLSAFISDLFESIVEKIRGIFGNK